MNQTSTVLTYNNGTWEREGNSVYRSKLIPRRREDTPLIDKRVARGQGLVLVEFLFWQRINQLKGTDILRGVYNLLVVYKWMTNLFPFSLPIITFYCYDLWFICQDESLKGHSSLSVIKGEYIIFKVSQICLSRDLLSNRGVVKVTCGYSGRRQRRGRREKRHGRSRREEEV